MPFKDIGRVIYGKNPIHEVVCQLRFPKILSINEDTPIEFQNKIRDEYPILNELIESQNHINISNQQSQPNISQSTVKNYQFVSYDGKWKLNLAPTFISVSTKQYTRWEGFYKKINEAVEIFEEIYKPAFYERIGLRYIDVFCRSELNLMDYKWYDLFEPYVLGFLGNKDIADNIYANKQVMEIKLSDEISIARVNAGIGKVNNKDEDCFVIDSDLFNTERTSSEIKEKEEKINPFNAEITSSELKKKLEYLHSRSFKLIRSTYKDILHDAMEPQEVE